MRLSSFRYRNTPVISLNIVIKRITNRKRNPLKTIQCFLKLSISDNTESFVFRKRFPATRLLSLSTEITAGSVTSLSDDAMMSSLPNFPVEGFSLSTFPSCSFPSFMTCLLFIHKCLGLFIPIPALYLSEYKTLSSLCLSAGIDDDVTFLSPLDRDLNTLTENCSPFSFSCCPIFLMTRRRRTLEARGACEGWRKNNRISLFIISPEPMFYVI